MRRQGWNRSEDGTEWRKRLCKDAKQLFKGFVVRSINAEVWAVELREFIRDQAVVALTQNRDHAPAEEESMLLFCPDVL